MRKTKIIAAVISLVLCLTLASCTTVEVRIPGESAQALLNAFFGGSAAPADTPEETTAAPATEATTTAPVTEATTASGETTTAAPTGEMTTAAGEVTTAAPATEATTAAPSNGAPSSKEEIIDYYVSAYNKIATEASSITRTYDYTNQYNGILDIDGNATLEKLAGTLMNQFMVENTDPLQMDINGVPPIGLSTISIPADKVSTAECKDNGDTYVITLKSTGTDDNWEIDSQPGVGSAGCIGPLLRTEDVSGAAGSFIKFEGLHTWYGTASVDATIDKASGHITQLHFLTPSVLHFDKVTAAVVVKVNNCNIGLLFHQDYTLTY